MSPDPALAELWHRFAGASFNEGLYRIITPGTVEQWDALVTDAFPEYARRLTCFGYDWLGRVFAVDAGRAEAGGNGVLLLEPGTGEALEIPCDVRSFHDEELIQNPDAALARSFHASWRASGGAVPTRTQCVGYKKPLFLGGKDNLSNLELTDLDVYWTISGALIRKAKGLPVGTRVGPINIGE